LITAILMAGFLGTAYALRDASMLVYYSVVPAVIVLAMVGLAVTGFVREDEKRVLQHFIGRAYRLRPVQDV
jgi:hypothetical protein